MTIEKHKLPTCLNVSENKNLHLTYLLIVILIFKIINR